MKKLLAFLLTAALLLPCAYGLAEPTAAGTDDAFAAYEIDKGQDAEPNALLTGNSCDIQAEDPRYDYPANAASYVRPSASVAYARMIAMKTSYPEGMAWTNDMTYVWSFRYMTASGIVYGTFTGGGCVAFSMILGDAAYGTNVIWRQYDTFSYDDIEVGDMVRCNYNTHHVTILEKTATYVIVAEGNYNSSIHWGRKISAESLMENISYIAKPYALDGSQTPTPTAKPTATPTPAPTATPQPSPQTGGFYITGSNGVRCYLPTMVDETAGVICNLPALVSDTQLEAALDADLDGYTGTLKTGAIVSMGGKTYALAVAGDVDCDGSVTAADAAHILRMTVKLESFSSAQTAAGLLHDGTACSANDAAIILRYLVKLEPLLGRTV